MEGSGERVQPLAMLYIRQTGKLIPARSIHLDLVAVERLNEAHFGALCVCVCVFLFPFERSNEYVYVRWYEGTSGRGDWKFTIFIQPPCAGAVRLKSFFRKPRKRKTRATTSNYAHGCNSQKKNRTKEPLLTRAEKLRSNVYGRQVLDNVFQFFLRDTH